jgi:hypothetical protein
MPRLFRAYAHQKSDRSDDVAGERSDTAPGIRLAAPREHVRPEVARICPHRIPR